MKDFEYQIKYQRAFEAILWNLPAIAIYSFRRAAFEELGLRDNDIIVTDWKEVMTRFKNHKS